MTGGQYRTLVGGAMVVLGIAQAVYYAVQGEVIPLVLGALFAAIGVAYLRFEAFGVEE